MHIQKTLGLAYFLHFYKKYFLKKIQLCHNTIWSPKTILSSRKTKEPIPRKFSERKKDLIYRTHLTMVGGPIRE